MTTAWHVNNGLQQFCDANGKPLAGGTVGLYTVGTLTPKAIWQDNNKVTPYANPLTLNSAGEPPNGPIFGDGQYRQIVKDASGNTIWDQNTESSQSTIAQADIIAALGYTPANNAGGNLTGPLNAPSVTLASAATMNIGAAAGEYIVVTGNVGITAFDNVQAGTVRRLRFSGTPLITCNTTSLIITGLANAQTFQVAVGDVLTFVSEGGGNWRLAGKTTSAQYALLAIQRISATGTYTRTPGTAAILVVTQGAGGGGASSDTATGSNGSGGGGGGAGQYREDWFTTGLNATESVTIATGGAQQTTANTAGNAGSGNTTFGAKTTASPGAGGSTMANGTGGASGAGGAGGSAGTSTGTLVKNIAGQAGGNSFRPAGGTGQTLAGDGGSSPLGIGGRGPCSSTQNGPDGTGFGSGGAGGSAQASTKGNGGAGTNGLVIVYEYAAI